MIPDVIVDLHRVRRGLYVGISGYQSFFRWPKLLCDKEGWGVTYQIALFYWYIVIYTLGRPE